METKPPKYGKGDQDDPDTSSKSKHVQYENVELLIVVVQMQSLLETLTRVGTTSEPKTIEYIPA